jgi:hypothetical protein
MRIIFNDENEKEKIKKDYEKMLFKIIGNDNEFIKVRDNLSDPIHKAIINGKIQPNITPFKLNPR